MSPDASKLQTVVRLLNLALPLADAAQSHLTAALISHALTGAERDLALSLEAASGKGIGNNEGNAQRRWNAS